MESNVKHQTKPSMWERFLRWVNNEKDKVPSDKIKFDLPGNKGDTDILLSQKQKETLQEAVDTAFYSRETSQYVRDTGYGKRSSSSGKDELMI